MREQQFKDRPPKIMKRTDHIPEPSETQAAKDDVKTAKHSDKKQPEEQPKDVKALHGLELLFKQQQSNQT